MPTGTITRPASTEYAPFYASYVERVPDGDVVDMLEHQLADTLDLVRGLSDADAAFRYAPDKWTIKQVLGHLGDTERIMCYRALRIARADATPLASFDENAFVSASRFDERTVDSLTGELRAVRAATVPFFRALDAEESSRTGTASGKTVSVRALAYIIAGHERHHRAILRERYGLPRRAR